MKLLILDCRTFEYKLDHKTPVGEEIMPEMAQNKYSNPLVIFTAIEDRDEDSEITKVAKDIRKIARANKSEVVIVNPFAHLSSNLAKPEKAVELLIKLTDRLKECPDFKTTRSVFGWYKQFTVDVKGHSNSQIYREY